MQGPRVQCTVLGYGPGPSEAIVEIVTPNGREQVVVDKGFLQNGELVIRRVLERAENKALVELPQESASGRWRIWVQESALAAG